MKKTIISILALGVTMSMISVQAESKNEGSREMKESKSTSMNEGASGVHQDFEMGMYTTVSDDIKTPSVGEVSSVNLTNEQPQSLHMSTLSRMKYRAAELIRERINSLNANAKAVTLNKNLTTEQKNTLTTIVSTNISGLTTLGVTIASSTDATSTKALVNSIYTNFRIYGIVIPQIRLEKRIYDLQNHSVRLSDTFLKVQTKINDYKGKGKDVTVWQKNLDDAKILVANDMNTLANVLTKVKSLTPSDYGTTSKMVFSAATTDIKNVAKDFNSIAKNLNKPKKLKASGGTSTSTVSATPVLVPAVTASSTATTTR